MKFYKQFDLTNVFLINGFRFNPENSILAVRGEIKGIPAVKKFKINLLNLNINDLDLLIFLTNSNSNTEVDLSTSFIGQTLKLENYKFSINGVNVGEIHIKAVSGYSTFSKMALVAMAYIISVQLNKKELINETFEEIEAQLLFVEKLQDSTWMNTDEFDPYCDNMSVRL
jgi:hypothetical protein